jgi:hypothetical protein
MAIRPATDLPIEEAEATFEGVPDAAAAKSTALQRGSLAIAPAGEPPLYGTRLFFERAAEQLLVSTTHGLELAGACYADHFLDRTILVGLARKGSGRPGRIAINPAWGSILWHTHPGLKGSLAAFSNEDLAAAAQAKKPLLVIGFGGLSPDVISTMALPLGLKGMLIGGGVKALLSLEKSGKLRDRLLRLGVAARVCYPSGTIRPVLRNHASPLRHAYEDVSFMIDQAVGTVERKGQAAIKRVIEKVTGAGE